MNGNRVQFFISQVCLLFFILVHFLFVLILECFFLFSFAIELKLTEFPFFTIIKKI